MSEQLTEGYKIFHAEALEGIGGTHVIHAIEDQIREASKNFEIEYLSNAKIDADPCGKNTYFGYQCCILRKKPQAVVEPKEELPDGPTEIAQIRFPKSKGK